MQTYIVTCLDHRRQRLLQIEPKVVADPSVDIAGYLARALGAAFRKDGCSPACDMEWSER